MNDEPVLISKPVESPSASSDEREGWTALLGRTKRTQINLHENPVSTQTTNPIKTHEKIHQSIGLLFITILFAILMLVFSSGLNGIVREVKMVRGTFETMAGEMSEMKEALDRSITTQLQIQAQLLDLSDKRITDALTANQGQIDGQTKATKGIKTQSIYIPMLISNAMSCIHKAYNASQQFIAQRILDLASFLLTDCFKSRA